MRYFELLPLVSRSDFFLARGGLFLKGGSELLAALKKKSKNLLFLLNNKLGFFLKRCGIFRARSKRPACDEPPPPTPQIRDAV